MVGRHSHGLDPILRSYEFSGILKYNFYWEKPRITCNSILRIAHLCVLWCICFVCMYDRIYHVVQIERIQTGFTILATTGLLCLGQLPFGVGMLMVGW